MMIPMIPMHLYPLLLCILIIFITLPHGSPIKIEALDPKVWKSQASIYYEDALAQGQFNSLRPFLCHFKDVFVDATAMYLQPLQNDQAMLDLYSCCTMNSIEFTPLHSMKLKCQNKSVHFSLCYCFVPRKNIVTVATPQQMKTIEAGLTENSNSFPGNTWLMHHGSFTKHPDHFSMKMLEFAGMIGNRGLTNTCCYNALPEKIHHLVSVDYPTENSTDFEHLIMDIVVARLGQTFQHLSLRPQHIPMSSLLDKMGFLKMELRLASFCFYLQNLSNSYAGSSLANHIKSQCVKHQKKVMEIPFYYAKSVFKSPRYKNYIPQPSNLTMTGFRAAVEKVFDASPVLPKRKNSLRSAGRPVVGVLLRSDGIVLRQLLNLHDVVLELRRAFDVTEIQIWYVSGKTRAILQASYFNSFDILVTTHSTQITNLLFSRNTSYVIEIQPDAGDDNTFVDIGQKVGLTYYLLRGSQVPATKGSRNRNETLRTKDYVVNLDILRNTLLEIKQRMNSTGQFLF